MLKIELANQCCHVTTGGAQEGHDPEKICHQIFFLGQDHNIAFITKTELWLLLNTNRKSCNRPYHISVLFYTMLFYFIYVLVVLVVAAYIFDHGLTQILHDDLHRLDVSSCTDVSMARLRSILSTVAHRSPMLLAGSVSGRPHSK